MQRRSTFCTGWGATTCRATRLGRLQHETRSGQTSFVRNARSPEAGENRLMHHTAAMSARAESGQSANAHASTGSAIVTAATQLMSAMAGNSLAPNFRPHVDPV